MIKGRRVLVVIQLLGPIFRRTVLRAAHIRRLVSLHLLRLQSRSQGTLVLEDSIQRLGDHSTTKVVRHGDGGLNHTLGAELQGQRQGEGNALALASILQGLQDSLVCLKLCKRGKDTSRLEIWDNLAD